MPAFFDLKDHTAEILHAYPSSDPSLLIYITADRVLWRGESPDRVECVGSRPQECLPEDAQDVVNWAEA